MSWLVEPLLCQIRKIVGFFQGFVPEPESRDWLCRGENWTSPFFLVPGSVAGFAQYALFECYEPEAFPCRYLGANAG